MKASLILGRANTTSMQLLGTNDANLTGNEQDNCLGPNAGTNEIDGKEGMDVILFQGPCEDYVVDCQPERNSLECTVTDVVEERDGVTVTSNIEGLAFSDGDFDVGNKTRTRTTSIASQTCWGPGWVDVLPSKWALRRKVYPDGRTKKLKSRFELDYRHTLTLLQPAQLDLATRQMTLTLVSLQKRNVVEQL